MWDVVACVVEDADEAEVLKLAGVDLRREVGGEDRLDLRLPVAGHETARQRKQSVRGRGHTGVNWRKEEQICAGTEQNAEI